MSIRLTGLAALAVATILPNQASAQYLTKEQLECVDGERGIRTYVRLLQSCSDAAFKRRDINEADAICAGAVAIARQMDGLVIRLLDQEKEPGTSEERLYCIRTRIQPLAPHLLAATDWSIAWHRVRKDSTGKDTFGPLRVHLPPE